MQLEDQRAADVDRTEVNQQLRTAVEEGRIDIQEYDERLQKAMTAKTYRELDGLVADLPATRSARRSQLAKRGHESAPVSSGHRDNAPSRTRCKGSAHPKSIKARWGSFGSAAVFFSGIWAFTWVVQGGSTPPYYWPIWILGFWGIGLLMSTMRHGE